MSKTRFWWLLLITGAAWIVLSIVILRFDYTTVAAVAVLFGVYCLVAAVNQIMIGAVSSSTGWRIAHGLLAALLVVVGVVSLMNLGATFVTLAAIISFYFIFRGCFDIAMALAGSAVSGWWVLLIAGLIELGLGFWAAGSWNISVVVLVAWVAAGALVHGIGEIALAFQIHQGRRGITALEGLADRLGVTNNHPAPDAAVPSSVTHRSPRASGHAQRRTCPRMVGSARMPPRSAGACSDRLELLIIALGILVAVVAAARAGALGTAIHDARSRVYIAQAQTRHTVTARATDDSTIVPGSRRQHGDQGERPMASQRHRTHRQPHLGSRRQNR